MRKCIIILYIFLYRLRQQIWKINLLVLAASTFGNNSEGFTAKNLSKRTRAVDAKKHLSSVIVKRSKLFLVCLFV